MAWDPLGSDAWTGDAPMDAFGAAMAAAAREHQRATKRLPFTSEIAEAFLAAIRDEPVLDARAAEVELAPWIALPRQRPKAKRPRARSGDVIAIPFGGDGARRIGGRVLFAPTKQRRGPKLGTCIVVHDLELPADAAAIASAPRLVGPLHVRDDEILEGRWPIIGNVPVADHELPTFAVRVPDGKGGWRPIVTDYFGAELPDTPDHRARVIEQSIGPASRAVIAVRTLRGLVGWLPALASDLGLTRPS